MSPELLGPAAEPFDLSFAGKGGATFDRAALVLVSNNPYVIDPRAGKGTRGDIDGGVLGVIAVTGPPATWAGGVDDGDLRSVWSALVASRASTGQG